MERGSHTIDTPALFYVYVCVPVVGISVFKLQDHLRARSRARSELRGGAAAVAVAAAA